MKKHRADLVSLVFGLVFLLIAVWWAVARRLDVNLPALGWLAAVALIVVGAAGLVGAVRGPREERTPADGQPRPGEPERGTDE